MTLTAAEGSAWSRAFRRLHRPRCSIVTYGEAEFNLLYCDDRGEWMSDTFHTSLQAAIDCAFDEFGVSFEEWELA